MEPLSEYIEEYVRETVRNASIEIDRRLCYRVAEEMRKFGWTCIPPVGEP